MKTMVLAIVFCSFAAPNLGAAPISFPPALRQEMAGAQTDAERLKLQGQELCDAMLRGDYAKAVDLTYPKLIQLMGGRAKSVSLFAASMKDLQSDQFRIVSVVVGEPYDMFDVKGQRYATVPTTMKFRVKEGLLVGKAFMIGVSADQGRHWTFVDSGGRELDKTQLKILFPAAADRLRIPEVKPPVLYSGTP